MITYDYRVKVRLVSGEIREIDFCLKEPTPEAWVSEEARRLNEGWPIMIRGKNQFHLFPSSQVQEIIVDAEGRRST